MVQIDEHPNADRIRLLWMVELETGIGRITLPFSRKANGECRFFDNYHEFSNNEHGLLRIRVCKVAGCTCIFRDRDGKAAYLHEIACYDPMFFGTLQRVFEDMKKNQPLNKEMRRSFSYRYPPERLFRAVAKLEQPEEKSHHGKKKDRRI